MRTAALAHSARHGALAATPEVTVQQLRQELRALVRSTLVLLRTADPAVHLDLSQTALEVLGLVVTERRAYPADVAQRLGLEEDAVPRAVLDLQQLGLVVPINDLSDPGAQGLVPTALVPTSMGRRIHDAGAAAASAALEATLVGWTADEVETLVGLLARLNPRAA